MGKCYNISFDSNFPFSGTNNNKKVYVTNWSSVLPENKAFKVSFSYMSEAAVLPNTLLMCLKTNLGQTNSFANNFAPTAFSSTNFIGFLKIQPMAGTTDSYYYADYTTNAPIYLKQRPTNTTLEVELHEGLGTANYTSPIPAEYILTLHFEEVDDY